MTRRSFVLAATFASFWVHHATAAPLPETMARLMATMPGTYDTAAQISAEASQGVPEASRHARRHVIYARIDVPQVGQNVLFRQERQGGPDGEIITRGLAVFEADDGANVAGTNGSSQKCSVTASGASNDWMPRAESQSPTFD